MLGTCDLDVIDERLTWEFSTQSTESYTSFKSLVNGTCDAAEDFEICQRNGCITAEDEFWGICDAKATQEQIAYDPNYFKGDGLSTCTGNSAGAANPVDLRFVRLG